MLNLAINARDAMDVGGTVTLETGNVRLGPPQRVEEPAAGEHVMIAVTDTGTGNARMRSWRNAWNHSSRPRRWGRVPGLGLSQVLGFAKQSGGGIRIETALGKGTTARVYLPRAKGVVALELMKSRSRNGAGRSRAPGPRSGAGG